jgi:hypothetical protein
MMVFGHETVFMSHLSTFSMPEHAYQGSRSSERSSNS